MSRPKPDPALSAVVRRLRAERDMTVETLAYEAGVTTGTLSLIELGRSAPHWSNFCHIAKALDLPIARIAEAVEAEKALCLCRALEPGEAAECAL